MVEAIIGFPVTERGAKRVSSRLKELARRFHSIALPLPEDLCIRVAIGSQEALEYARNLMGSARFRIWSSVLLALKDLALDEIDAGIGCYTTMESYKASEALGYTIAALVVKARAYNLINEEEWLETLKIQTPKIAMEKIREYNAIIADGYSWAYRLYRELAPRRVYVVEKLIPTPLDILELMALNYIDRAYVREVIDFAIKYISEYIVTSPRLTNAYDKLLEDNDYLRLLEKLKLEIFNEIFKIKREKKLIL